MSGAQYQIRAIGVSDLEPIVVLDRQLGGQPRDSFFRHRFQAMGEAPDDYLGLAACSGDGVCGHLQARVLRGEFGCVRPVAVIDALGVQHGEQGAGVGLQLLKKVRDQARELGCGELRTQASWYRPDLLGFFHEAGFALGDRNVLERDTTRMPLDADDDELAAPAAGLPQIRSLAESDINDLIRIDSHIVGSRREAYLRRKISAVLGSSGIRVSLVAEQDGLVAGYIMAQVDHGSFGRTNPVAVIDTLGVAPEYAGNGIGSHLMGQLVDNLASLKVERVRTEVEWRNFSLGRFLARCDFTTAQQLSLTCPI